MNNNRLSTLMRRGFILVGLMLFNTPFIIANDQQDEKSVSKLSPDSSPTYANNFRDLSPQERQRKINEMTMLDRFLRLPPDKLRQIRLTIEKIENMPLEEREALRNQIQAFKKLHPRQQEDMRRRFDSMSLEDRELMRHHWLGMTHEERINERRKMQHMSPQERHRYHREIIHRARENQIQKRPPIESSYEKEKKIDSREKTR